METMTKPTSPAKEKNLIQVASETGSILSQNITEEENSGRLSAPIVRALKEAGLI